MRHVPPIIPPRPHMQTNRTNRRRNHVAAPGCSERITRPWATPGPRSRGGIPAQLLEKLLNALRFCWPAELAIDRGQVIKHLDLLGCLSPGEIQVLEGKVALLALERYLREVQLGPVITRIPFRSLLKAPLGLVQRSLEKMDPA